MSRRIPLGAAVDRGVSVAPTSSNSEGNHSLPPPVLGRRAIFEALADPFSGFFALNYECGAL